MGEGNRGSWKPKVLSSNPYGRVMILYTWCLTLINDLLRWLITASPYLLPSQALIQPLQWKSVDRSASYMLFYTHFDVYKPLYGWSKSYCPGGTEQSRQLLWSVSIHLPQYLSTVMGEGNRGSRKRNGFALQALCPSNDPIYMLDVDYDLLRWLIIASPYFVTVQSLDSTISIKSCWPLSNYVCHL
jgi:hypothetical protein